MLPDVLPLYGSELDDLYTISRQLHHFMQSNEAWGKLKLLYVDGVEITVGTDGGENDAFRIWWDGESEQARIERKASS